MGVLKMEQEQKKPVESKGAAEQKPYFSAKKRHWLQYLITYLCCLLVACLVFMVVRYSIHSNGKADQLCLKNSETVVLWQDEDPTPYV